MHTPTKLTHSEISAAIQKLRPWRLAPGDKLKAEFKFKTFPEAFCFMTRVAFEAEAMNHHPDFSNSYNRVEIELTTHDSGGVTVHDIGLARKITEIIQERA